MEDWKQIIRDAASFAQQDLDDDIAEELASHARSAYEAARADGSSPETANAHVQSLVRAWMSEAGRLRRRPRQAPLLIAPSEGISRLSGIANDLRYGVRLLVRQKKYSALAILTIGLGLGILTTLSSVGYAVLLKPLPWSEPDRLIRLAESRQGATRQFPWSISNGSYLAWADQPSTIENLAGYSTSLITITGAGDTARIRIGRVTASTFALLRSSPLLGSVFTAQDEPSYQQASKVVLSYGLWQERFGGDPAVLGKIIQFEGKPETIVAVMPRSFAFPDNATRAWLPYQVRPVVDPEGKGSSTQIFNALARLRPGATPAQAATEATARARTAPDGSFATLAIWGTNNPPQVSATPALEALTAEVRPAIVAMFAAVILLLCGAIANVAGLQLARAATRRREIAIRTAIGAGTWQITRQLLSESVLLSLAGGVFGLLLALGLHQAVPSILPADFPRLDDLGIDLPVIVFLFALTLIAGFAVGLAPVLQMRRLSLVEGAVDLRHSRAPRARSVTAAGQVAIACTLLIGAVLLTRSFVAMIHADRGYDFNNLLTVRVLAPDFLISPERRIDIIARTLERGMALPGVRQIAFTDSLPLGSGDTLTGFTMPSPRPPVGTEIRVNAVRHVVSKDYFQTLGIAPIAGRVFDVTDAGGAKAVVVNRAFASKYLSEGPIGDRISNFFRGDGVEYTVIGVIPDVVQHGLQDPVQPEIYSLNLQMPLASFAPAQQNFILKLQADPRSLIEPLKGIFREQDSALMIDSLMTMEDRVSSTLAKPRLYAILLGTFACSALVIAGAGLFGVLSYNVAQRSREFAVRTALGATPRNVLSLVVKEGLLLCLAGISIGLVMTFFFVRYLTALLYGVTTHDSFGITMVCLTITTVATVSSLIPAWRAVRMNPIENLKA